MSFLSAYLSPGLNAVTNTVTGAQGGQIKADQIKSERIKEAQALKRQQQQDQIQALIAERKAKHDQMLERFAAIKGGPGGQLVDFNNPDQPMPVGPAPVVKPTPWAPSTKEEYKEVHPEPRIDPLSPEGIAAQGQVTANKPHEAKRPNEIAVRASLVYPRAAEAAQVLDKYYSSGAPKTSLASHVPILGNMAMSDEARSMTQAAETVASAILRLESGAAISPKEVQSYARQFLPQVGDDAATLAQKKATLQTQLARMKAVADAAMNTAGVAQEAPIAPDGARVPLSARVAQLKAQGMSKDQAQAKLLAEGYDLNGGGE